MPCMMEIEVVDDTGGAPEATGDGEGVEESASADVCEDCGEERTVRCSILDHDCLEDAG